MTDDPGEQAGRVRRSFAALDRAVQRRARREDTARREGGGSMVRNLGMMGVLGWLFVTPALLLGFFGRWLDRVAGTGITLTAALLLAGIAAGGWLVWRRIAEEGLLAGPDQRPDRRPDGREGS